MRVDFPRFEGIDVLQWIYKAEQYFEYYRIDEEERLQLDVIYFDRPVVPWYQMLKKSGILTSWTTLVKALEQAYGPSVYESLAYALFKLIQEDSVNNYYANFTALANRVEIMSNSAFLACFISGLKRDIQRDVIPWKPESILVAVSLAKLYEEKYPMAGRAANRRPIFIPDISAIGNTGKGVATPTLSIKVGPVLPALGPPTTQPAQVSSGNYTHPYQKISFNEMQIRKVKGLCFNCDEKFTPSHKCANRRLLLLKWEEEPPDNPH